MEANDRQSIFKSLMPPKFVHNRPKRGQDDNKSKESKSRSKSPVDSYTRRRQQVKRAQVNHRRKKDESMSALEGKVKRLRELVAQQQSLKNVERENQSLREILAAHGIEAQPSSRCSFSKGLAFESAHDFVQVSLVGSPGPEQHLEPSVPIPIEGLPDCLPLPPGEAKTASTSPVVDSGSYAEHDLMLSARVGEGMRNINLEGFDFVMRLEQPCLPHVHTQDGSPQAPGHILTLQSASLTYAPPGTEPGTNWSVPIGEMQRLLELSAMLPLSGELTPIQAWSQLMNHPGSSLVGRETLHELTTRLTLEVRCYGFGAVIEEGAFQKVLGDFM